jgi:hypothetical protein
MTDELAQRRGLKHAQQTADEAQATCPHAVAMLDEDQRRLYCKECGADLDPFDVLVATLPKPEPADR